MKDFTKKLAEFFKKELGATDEFCKEIEECKDFSEIHDCFEESTTLKKLMGVDDLQYDIEELQEEVDDLETSVRNLESEVSDLEDELGNIQFTPATYWDEEKFEIFVKNHEKFTPTQLEEILTVKR